MSQINIPNDYPVEITPPDITPYARGNTDIPYLWRFDSGQPGPNVMVSAIVHGNEPCGAVAIDQFLREDLRPEAGTLSFVFMNIEAYQAFDPADPNATRWLDEDMNRVWDAETLDGDRNSLEIARARQVRPALAEVDYLYDIHSMQHLAPPLMMSGRHAKAKELAQAVGEPEFIVGDVGHAAGRRMRDYGAFDDPASAKTALLIECGQHWEASASTLAYSSTLRFLVATGTLGPSHLEGMAKPKPQQRFSVSAPVTIQSDQFRFAQAFTGGEIIAKKGTIIGYDGDMPVKTEADDTMLVMPSKRLWKGQTAVRLATRD